MKIQIDKLEIQQVTESIGTYIMKEIKECNNVSIEWLEKSISFYRTLVDMEDFLDLDDKFILVEVPDEVLETIVILISKFIYTDIKENDCDINWVSAMMGLYLECKKRLSQISLKTAYNDDSNVSANGQEIKINNLEGEEYEQGL